MNNKINSNSKRIKFSGRRTINSQPKWKTSQDPFKSMNKFLKNSPNYKANNSSPCSKIKVTTPYSTGSCSLLFRRESLKSKLGSWKREPKAKPNSTQSKIFKLDRSSRRDTSISLRTTAILWLEARFQT